MGARGRFNGWVARHCSEPSVRDCIDSTAGCVGHCLRKLPQHLWHTRIVLRARLVSPFLRRCAWLALLAAALLVAQTAGLMHRIEHVGFEHPRFDTAVGPGDEQPQHDCDALDAATTGNAPPPVLELGLDPVVASERARCAQATWQASAPTLGYSPRAPPRA